MNSPKGRLAACADCGESLQTPALMGATGPASRRFSSKNGIGGPVCKPCKRARQFALAMLADIREREKILITRAFEDWADQCALTWNAPPRPLKIHPRKIRGNRSDAERRNTGVRLSWKNDY